MRQLALISCLLLVASLSSAAFIEKSLENKVNDSEFTEVIVTFNDTAPHGRFDANSAGNLDQVDGFKIERKFRTARAGVLKVKRKDLARLKRSNAIENVIENIPVHAVLTESIPLINSTLIQSRRPLGISSNGSGETVCVIDTGVNYYNPSLGGCFGAGCKVIGGWDFVNNDADPMDDNGHGTHVAGIVAASGAVTGVAPGANIVAVKVLNSAGQGTLANLMAGIDWCNNNATTFNISSMSISIGDGGANLPTDGICTAFDALFQSSQTAGIFVAAASGNDGYSNGINSPACSQYAVSVGATYDGNLGTIAWGSPLTCTDNTVTNNITCFTDRSQYLKLLAPGALITSTQNNGTATQGGTSQATPHVAGVAALIFADQKHERGFKSTPSQLLSALNSTGSFTQDPLNGSRYFPRVNAYAALLALDNTTASVLSVNFTNSSYTNRLNLTAVFEMNEFVTCNYSVNGTTSAASGNLSVSVTFNTNITNKNVTLTCADGALNVGSSVLFFNTDFSTPNSTINYTQGILLNGSSNITVIPSDVGASGINTTYYCVDSSGTCDPLSANGSQNGNSTLLSAFNFTLSSSLHGNLTVSVISVDNASNVQTVNQTNITVNTLPVLSSASLANASLQGGQSQTIYTTSSDADSNHNVTIFVCSANQACINNATIRLCTNTSTSNPNCTYTTAVEDTNKTVYVFAFDTYNESAANNVSLTYETSIVTPQIYNISIVNITTSTANVTFNASKLVTFNFSYGTVQNTLNQNYTVNELATSHIVNLTSLNQQTIYYFNLTVTDQFGNQNSTTGNFETANITNITLSANTSQTINYSSYAVLIATINTQNTSFNLTISQPQETVDLGNYTYAQTQWQLINNTNDAQTQYNFTFYYNSSLVAQLNLNESTLAIFKLNESTNNWTLQTITLNESSDYLFLENVTTGRYALGALLLDNQTCTYSSQCANHACSQDYDGTGAFCASNNFCSHNGASNLSAALCYSNNAYTCSASQWTQTACSNGCSSGACILLQVTSSGGGGGGGSVSATTVNASQSTNISKNKPTVVENKTTTPTPVAAKNDSVTVKQTASNFETKTSSFEPQSNALLIVGVIIGLILILVAFKLKKN